MRSGRFVDDFRVDFRLALRLIRHHRVSSSAVILAFAVATGFNASLFRMVDALIFRAPTGLTAPETLVQSPNAWLLTKDQYYRIKENLALLAVAGSSNLTELTIESGSGQEPLAARFVTHNYFSLLGAPPFLGRSFASEDDQGTATGIVLGYRFWRNRLGGREDIIGETVRVSAVVRTIIGVAPEGFAGVDSASVDAWLPLEGESHVPGGIRLVGRLSEGASVGQATDELRAVFPEDAPILSDTPGPRPQVHLSVVYQGWWSRLKDLDALVFYLLAAGGIVVLVACANISNVMLTRVFQRRREFAIRMQLGAATGQIVRQILSELLVLLVAAGGLAALMSAWTVPLLSGILTAPVPGRSVRTEFPEAFYGLELQGAGPDVANLRMLIAIGVIIVLCTVISGIAPIAYIRGRDLSKSWKALGAVDIGHNRWGRALLIVQVALTVALLVCAGSFQRSFQNATAVDHGIDIDNVLIGRVDFRRAAIAFEDASRLFDELTRTAGRHPGVVATSIAHTPPIGRTEKYYHRWEIPGYQRPWVGEPIRGAFVEPVSSGYFEMLGMRIVDGRDFTDSDTQTSSSVLIVSETFAREFFRSETPIGKCVEFAFQDECRRIVGVVSDVRVEIVRDPQIDRLEKDMAFYVPVTQWWLADYLLIETRDGSTTTLADLGRILNDVDPLVPYIELRRLSDHRDQQTHGWRAASTVFGAFGVLALLLATVGTYAVLSTFVKQRKAEIGIRMALGASPGNILQFNLGAGMLPVVVGVIIGTVAGVVSTVAMRSFLFGVTLVDPLILGLATATIGIVTLIACLKPVYEAVRVDPASALRAD